ncbi:hypothetical protein EJ07DRAFT_181443 [Lizonia empirigonia]|nr:hypothetical protein EJ07DRAFT_181443 [Lizonia empirigonia]
MDEDLMQERVTFWRSLLHRLNFNLGELDQEMSEKLVLDTRQTLRICMELIDRSGRSLLSDMSIIDSRRSIAEAESVSKLTELAFAFIPLSFVASLFSIQVHELGGGVPLFQSTLGAIDFVVVAYGVRLSIRSSRLIEYKNKIFLQMRGESELHYNEAIPTHKSIVWASSTMDGQIFKIIHAAVWVVGPLVLILGVFAVVLSPIVLPWQQHIDRGFSAVITVLMLLLDAILIVPVAVNMSNAGIVNFNPKEYICKIKRRHEVHRKRREKAKKRARQEASLEPEALDDESSVHNDITSSLRLEGK